MATNPKLSKEDIINLRKIKRELDTAAKHKVLVSVPDSLEQFSDQELRDELKRRTEARKVANFVFRCRDCKHCGEGCCNRSGRYKTSVCFLKPKPQVGPDRYYATLHSRKACEQFELKQ